MIAPETLAAALRVAQHGARSAMLSVRTLTAPADGAAQDDGPPAWARAARQPDAPDAPDAGASPQAATTDDGTH